MAEPCGRAVPRRNAAFLAEPATGCGASVLNEFNDRYFANPSSRRYGDQDSSLRKLNCADSIKTTEQLEEMLSEPSAEVIEMMGRLEGDVILLGVGGKIGPSLARMARRATDLAGVKRRIIGVSRFSASREEARLNAHGVETMRCDLLDDAAVRDLPAAPNVIFMAGMKFGSTGNEAATWAMNSFLPGVVCRNFRSSRVVAFSTGAVYGLAPIALAGSREMDIANPVGEYAMSCLGRERILEHFSRTEGIPMAVIRLFYACELRYGVLVDLARKIMAGAEIDLEMGYFNIIWQADSNAATLRALEHTAVPPLVLNVTGPELLRVRDVAVALGTRLGREPIFRGQEQETSCIGNAEQADRLLGRPRITASQLLDWVAQWVKDGGEIIDKPTHFESRDGRY